MRFFEVIEISQDRMALINRYLHEEPKDESACQGEDNTIRETAIFENGFEMDIKCCGVQYQEDQSNLSWTEAVLFHNRAEVCHTEVDDEFMGEWQIKYGGDEYVVQVICEH